MADAPPGPERETLAASVASGAHPPRRDEPTLELATARAEQALVGEADLALRLATWTGAPIFLLLWLALVADADLAPSTPGGDDLTVWTGSLLSLLLLLVASQLVSIQLALEHRVATGRQLAGLWLVRAAVVAAVVAAVLAAGHGLGQWREVVLVALPIELAVLVVAWLAREPVPRVDHPVVTPDPAPREKQDERQLLAIGASGGGIRAAAFVLGGHQAVQEQAARLHVADPDKEPHVFAVSGGSYIAAALALRRTYDAGTGLLRTTDPGPFTDSYCQDSPELERLRRHTRYLFEPAWRTKDGLVSLATGAVLNLFILGIALRFVTWVGSQFAMTVGLVGLVRSDVDGDGAEEVVDLTFARSWTVWDWLLVTWLPLVCLLAVAVLTWVSWRSTAAFDDASAGATLAAQDDTAQPRRTAVARMQVAARSRVALVFVAIGWLLVVVGIPGATVGVSALATSNKPVTTAASTLEAVGFATRDMCVHAFVEQVDDAVTRASDEAAISPGEKREVETGACGLETTVSRTAEADGTTVPADLEAARRFADSSHLPLQVAGIGALLALVTSLLRRGPSPETSADTGMVARVKRVLLTYLPMAIVAGLGAYLALRWTFGFLAGSDAAHTVAATVLTAVACTLAYLVDANATSMHSFYRSRLSDAFAVGIDPADGRAKELPSPNVYRFSDLADGAHRPRLHIVTTLNTQADNEAPSMRGGFPFVFGPDEVEIHREEGRRVHVATSVYEEFAGPGRVSIMAAVATSGAAISPLMGRYAIQMAPYRALLALFNVRVGTWVRNPMHVREEPGVEHDRPRFLWMTRKPGLAQVALEAVGRSSADRRWVYLSDGGHLDNTGLVECVRHCVRQGTRGRVLILDASNDPVDTWSAVGDALSVIRADLGVDLQRVAVEEPPPWMRRYRGSGLDVIVVKAVRTEAPAGTPATRDWYSVLPPNVQSFQLVHKDFPRAATARQKFGDLEFEAYRSLGYAATLSAVAVGGWLEP